MLPWRALALAVVLAAAGCGGGGDSEDLSPADSGWTVGSVSQPSTVGTGTPLIADLRTGVHDEYDRVTMELEDAAGFPGYHVEYVDRPLRECGSGRQIRPVGDGWIELRLEPARAHTEAGESTLPGTEFPVEGALLQRIYRTCDFEGMVTVVLALASPEPFRVFTLTDPRRVVVDVRRREPAEVTRSAPGTPSTGR